MNSDDVADCTGPVDCRDSTSGLTEAVTTDSVTDCVDFAARERLIDRSGSVDLDILFVFGVAEAADGIPEGRRRVPEACLAR